MADDAKQKMVAGNAPEPAKNAAAPTKDTMITGNASNEKPDPAKTLDTKPLSVAQTLKAEPGDAGKREPATQNKVGDAKQELAKHEAKGGVLPAPSASALSQDYTRTYQDGQQNKPEGSFDPKLPSTWDDAGAQTDRPPHTVVLADGLRGNDETGVSLHKSGQKLVRDGDTVKHSNVFIQELEKLHDEIARLTKEYTEGGLQVSDFPPYYEELVNRYRIKAASLNRGVGGVGPEETKVAQEIEIQKAQNEQRLRDARAQDAKNLEERNKK